MKGQVTERGQRCEARGHGRGEDKKHGERSEREREREKRGSEEKGRREVGRNSKRKGTHHRIVEPLALRACLTRVS